MNMENILFSKKVLLNFRLQFSADVNFKNPYQKLRRPLATKLQWPNFFASMHGVLLVCQALLKSGCSF